MPVCARCGANRVVAGCCHHLTEGMATFDPRQHGSVLVCTSCSGGDAKHPVCRACLTAVRRHNVAVSDRRPFGYVERETYFRVSQIHRPKLLAFGPGDFVKVALSKNPLSEPKWLESLWVRVKERDGDWLRGAVDNDPELFSPRQLRRGSTLEFSADNVIDASAGEDLVERPHSCPVCLGEGRRLDDGDRKLLEDVRRFGIHILRVAADDDGPGFAFTVGLHHRFEHPEVIVVGLDQDTSQAVLNRLGSWVADGKSPDLSGLLEGTSSSLRRPSSAKVHRDYLGYACWFYQNRTFPVRQLVWSGCESVL